MCRARSGQESAAEAGKLETLSVLYVARGAANEPDPQSVFIALAAAACENGRLIRMGYVDNNEIPGDGIRALRLHQHRGSEAALTGQRRPARKADLGLALDEE